MKKAYIRSIVAVAVLCFTAAVAWSQDIEHTNYSADKTLRSYARINPTTLAMELSIPLPSYPGRAGNSLPNSIAYSSKVWGAGTPSRYSGFLGSITDIHPVFAQLSMAGWNGALGVPLIDDTVEAYDYNTGRDWVYDAELPQNEDFDIDYIKRFRIVMPDGTVHEVRSDDGAHSYGTAYTPGVSDTDRYSGTFLSVDGSRMRLEWTYTGGYWHNILYMPDGGRYMDLPTWDTYTTSGTVKYYDRSGNKMTYDFGTHAWTDTLGRVLVNPLQINAQSHDPSSGTQTFSYPTMTGGAAQDIQFVWTNLDTQQSSLSYTSQIYCIGNGYNNIPNGATNLFSSYATYPTIRTCGGSSVFDPVVLTAIILPNGAKYAFHYNVYAEIERIDYPTGGYERFAYDYLPPLTSSGQTSYDQFNRGVTDRYVSSDGTTGSEVHWQYAVQRDSTFSTPGPYHVKTFAPNGTWSEQLLHDRYTHNQSGYGFDGPGLGQVYEVRAYNNTTSNTLLRRTLMSSAYTGPLTIGGVLGEAGAYRDVRPEREVSMIFESGSGNALVSMSETLYDTSGNSDSGYFSSLNVIQTKTYNYVVQSASTAASANIATAAGWFSSSDVAAISEADYFYDANYETRNLTGLVTEKRIKDGNGNINAKTQFTYDESSYVTSTSGSMPSAAAGSWLDPTGTGTDQLGSIIGSKRGLPTSIKSYSDVSNGYYIETHGFYDQYGNATIARDGRNNDTTTGYDAAYAFAYPTTVTTAVPDPTGVNGSNTPFSTSSTYDYNTGLPLTVTDANDQTTAMEYVDPLLRVSKTTAPNGQQTITEYGSPGSSGQFPLAQRFVHGKTQIDNSHWKEGYTWADGLGRSIKSQTIDSNGDIFALTCYDAMGRVEKTSNPFRNVTTPTCSSSLEWTTQTYDKLGRVVSTTSPDSSSVGIAFGLSTSAPIGTTKTVTDQAGKTRRGISNSLGRMVRVIEDVGSGHQNLVTDYTFDILDNLRKTTQDSQHRYFMYDSLGRLLFAKQVEQDTNSYLSATDPVTGNTAWSVKYQYDDNSNITSTTDAKGISVSATYDKLNRIILRNYSDNTPAVGFFYDGTGLDSVPANSKGKTTKVASSVSETRYMSFDEMGRLLTHRQRTDGNDYDTSYTYNLSGALIEETYPSLRVVRNTLNQDGELSQVQSRKDPNYGYWAYANSFTYNAAGALTKMQVGNGRWENFIYNNRQQVTEIGLGATDSTQNLLKLELSYGTSTQNNGSLREQKITVPMVGSNSGFTAIQSYVYDDLNRIQSATETIGGNQTWKQTFIFDRYGNRRFDASNTTTLGSCTEAVCNPTISTATNRITSSGYSYDSNGSVTQDAAGQRFGYDAENHQKEFFNANNPGSTPDATYLYDGEGRRVKKISSTETTVFVYDASSQLIAEYSTALAQTQLVSYLTTDHLGSPRAITNENGAVTSRKDFSAFGEETVTPQRTQGLGYTPPEIRQDYTGYQKDEESGLEFAQARYFNPTHGRFTSIDPLAASIATKNPQTFNRYSYALNSPYKFTDPLGLLSRGAGGCSAEYSSCDEDGNGIGVDREAERIYQTEVARLQAQQAFARGDIEEGWERIRQSEGALQAVDQNRDAVQDVGIEVIVWAGHGPTPATQNGHVSYVIDGYSYSWQWYADPSTGNQVYYIRTKEEYIEERSKSSAGTGYVLDFGSPDANQRFKDAIKNAYDSGKGYNIATNNCGHAFQRAINAVAPDGTPRDRNGNPNYDSIHPFSHKAFITSSLSKYIVQINPYPYTGSWWRRGIK